MRTLFLALSFLLPLAGCSRNPSVLLDPAGPHARSIGYLFWHFAAVSAVVWLVVLLLVAIAFVRRRTADGIMPEPMVPNPHSESRARVFVGLGIAMTFVVLTSFVGLSYAVDRRLIELDHDPALVIEVTAHQWWWELRYKKGGFVTANEIHVPVDTPVRLVLTSNDVIHSVWFPNLAGKQDVIPGRSQDMIIRPDRLGAWHGRCAEFCGNQHAFMGLKLVVDTKNDFEHWQGHQMLPAAEPKTDEEKLGEKVFTNGPCGLCHVIRGTTAAGYSSYAPDLTHLKSRTTIGAGTAPNSKGHLAGWINDPHGLKPGVHMPTILQKPREFQALLSYLETLR
jgi:cytochrome c oxidase subunit 2